MPVSAYVQAALFVVLAVALLGVGGNTTLRFWVYLAIFAAVMIVSFAVLDPGLFVSACGRASTAAAGAAPPLPRPILHWIVAGLDRGRFHWSDNCRLFPRVGLVAVAAGFGLALWAMLVNRFFSSVVRIQSDRGQYVIATGPYRWIRHPGYLAGVVIMVASGIALGSWLAAAMPIAFGPRSCCTGPSPKTACCRPSCQATATTRPGCAGACCRGFGEARQGLVAGF